MTIMDTGGIDWLRLSSDRASQVINLAQGTISSVYGLTGNLSIAWGTIIEHVAAGQGADIVSGNAANNWLLGGAGADTIWGKGGNDSLDGGAGADRLVGGAGDDLYIIDALDTLIEMVGGGFDRIRAAFNYQLGEHFEALVLSGTARFGTGNAADNGVTGNEAANHLSGGWGHDTLFGLGGNDTLAGNAGRDRLVGGDGNDIYMVDLYDSVVEAAGGGYDTIKTPTDFIMPIHVERIEATGNAAVRLTGNAQANLMIGNGAANVLIGGGGNDVMVGGGGRDSFVFSAGQRGRVSDFQNDVDTLQIRGTAGRTVDGILSTATQSGGGVDIVFGQTAIRVDGVTIAELRDDFMLI